LEEYRGIILRKIIYKESSEIIHFYTEKGRLSILVHGNRKIKSPYLNVMNSLNIVKVIVSGQNMKTLRDAELIRNYSLFSNDFEKYTYCLHILELINYFSEHEHDHEKLILFYEKVMNKIQEEQNYIEYLYSFELKMLYLLGVQPALKSCGVCQKQDELLFSVDDGGVFCKEHAKGKIYDSNILEKLRKLYYYDINVFNLPKLQDNELKAIRLILDEYYEYHLNYHSKARSLLKGFLGY
jgi:DNA repair protein RecO (recombination protein O)